MIAKATIFLPFTFTLPDNELFLKYTYNWEGYIITIYPPAMQEGVKTSPSNGITINGKSSYQADLLVIDFQKGEFNRTTEIEFDPPIELIAIVANDFLNRLRHVLKASQIKPISSSGTNIRIDYLNDDSSILEKKEGLLRERFRKGFKFEIVSITKEAWDDIHSIPLFQELPIWKSLLLDAEAILPEIGPSIVLTFTSLEVFIAKTLDLMAEHNKSDLELWTLLNKHESRNLKIENRFKFLSKHFIGATIADDAKLWKAFDDLRLARNSFAHKGIAKIQDEIVTVDKTRELIHAANSIINYLRQKLPAKLQWKEFNHMINIGGIIPIDLEK
jgi:hypothetical protein